MVLIKNMEMPKGCSWFDKEGKHHSCRFCLAYICSITGECIASSVERRHQSCPLVELPPHGYLGDLSELSMTLYSELETQTPKTLGEVMKIIKKVFDDAPTVLEASV